MASIYSYDRPGYGSYSLSEGFDPSQVTSLQNLGNGNYLTNTGKYYVPSAFLYGGPQAGWGQTNHTEFGDPWGLKNALYGFNGVDDNGLQVGVRDPYQLSTAQSAQVTNPFPTGNQDADLSQGWYFDQPFQFGTREIGMPTSNGGGFGTMLSTIGSGTADAISQTPGFLKNAQNSPVGPVFDAIIGGGLYAGAGAGAGVGGDAALAGGGEVGSGYAASAPAIYGGGGGGAGGGAATGGGMFDDFTGQWIDDLGGGGGVLADNPYGDTSWPNDSVVGGGAGGGFGGLQAAADTLKKYGVDAALIKSLLSGAARAAPAALGAYGANQQSQAYTDLANKYMALGAPSRDRYEASFAPGFSLSNDPGYQDAINAASKANLHALSLGGNPALSPNAQAQNLQDLYSRVSYPALQNYRNMNANAGGIASLQTAAPGAAGAGINAGSGVYNALGAGLNDIFNPPKTMAEQLAEYRRIMAGG